MINFSQKLFLFVNMGFCTVAGGLLATSIRLFWDSSVYDYLRRVFPDHYQILTWYIPVSGVYLIVLACLAISAIYPRSMVMLNVYLGGLVLYVLCEVGFVSWLVVVALEKLGDQDTIRKELNFNNERMIQIYKIGAILALFALMQLTGLILSCVLQTSRYTMRARCPLPPSEQAWTPDNEYHANGKGTTCPRTSRRYTVASTADLMWPSAPPPSSTPNYYH